MKKKKGYKRQRKTFILIKGSTEQDYTWKLSTFTQPVTDSQNIWSKSGQN